ncbi:MAG: protein kinase [Tolypothrix sp. Co-bin9]|nr:protein kinase [Tolypothrix sp. Co-bin9]
MRYCINPDCRNRQNPDNLDKCQVCDNDLLIKGRYWLVKHLRPLNTPYFDVFETDDRKTAKVLKVLKTNQHQKYVELFEQEARILTNLRHPGIPKAEPEGDFLWQLNNDQKLRCLLMEKIEGQNLEQWLQQNQRIDQDYQALDWLIKITNILDYVHSNRFFHRDIKPSNIMLKPDGQLVLIDFGTARKLTDTVINGEDVTEVCSHGYTAPEQIGGKAVPQSDFFALGRTFVHLLTGRHPDRFSQNRQTKQLIWREYAENISPLIANFIDELMAPLVNKRPRNAEIILQRLDEIDRSLANRRTEPPSPPRSHWSVITFRFFIILLVSVPILWWIFFDRSPTANLTSPCSSPALDVSEMAFSPNGNYLVTASLDNTVRVLKASSDNKQVACEKHDNGVVAVKLSPDEGKIIATASLDGKVGLWNMNTDGSISLLQFLEHEKSPVVALSFSPKGNYLATATAGGSVRVWDTKTFQEIKLIPYNEYVRAISFSHDENYLAIVGLTNKVHLWEWQVDKPVPIPNEVVSLAFSPKDGKYLATTDAKGNAQVRDITTFNVVKTVNLKTYPTTFNFSPEGKDLLFIGVDKKAKLWKWEKYDTTIPLEDKPNNKVVAVAFSPKDGKYIATASANGIVTVWNNNGTKITDLPNTNKNKTLVGLAFSPTDEKQLAVVSADGSVQIRKW